MAMIHAAADIESVISRARALPSAPWLLPRLMEKLADPESAADQVEGLIKMDAGLAIGTLRLANSAYFNNSVPCDTLNDAIVRLGFREIYRLATTTVASGWLGNDVEGYGWEPGDLYRHSLTTAVAADMLARKTGACDAEIAYTGGLLHDVGKLALAYACSEHFGHVRQRQSQTRSPWRVAEHDTFGYDHTDVAGRLLEAWQFPENLIEVVRFYPRPSLASPAHLPLVTCIHAAKHLALCVGIGVGEDGYQSELDEACLRAAGITPDVAELLLPEVVAISSKLLRDHGAA